jgi:hypothetical protein
MPWVDYMKVKVRKYKTTIEETEVDVELPYYYTDTECVEERPDDIFGVVFEDYDIILYESYNKKSYHVDEGEWDGELHYKSNKATFDAAWDRMNKLNCTDKG